MLCMHVHVHSVPHLLVVAAAGRAGVRRSPTPCARRARPSSPSPCPSPPQAISKIKAAKGKASQGRLESFFGAATVHHSTKRAVRGPAAPNAPVRAPYALRLRAARRRLREA